MRQLNCADLFAGAGGTSSGAESTGAARVRFAVNHWSVAVQTHSANFPNAKHVNSRLDQVSPSECGKIDLLFASPECTHHSRARGGRPTSDQQRSGAWDVLKWIEFHRPSWVVIENVREFEAWGPVADNGRPLVSKRGAFFDAWIMAIQAAGYSVDWRRLNAADFGAATTRERLFVGCRLGRKSFPWPEPTHCRSNRGALPAMRLQEWRQAHEVIDWRIPCPPISRLRERTRRQAGAMHAEAGQPIIYSYYGNAGYSLTTEPLPTITTKDRFALVDGAGLRMLQPHELRAAQGFPESYVLCGTKSDAVKQIGNSVSPPVAAAITRAIAGVA